MDKFTRQYFETALWSSTDESRDDGGDPLDKNYSVGDISNETRDKMIADCADFQERFGELYSDSEQAGHDFWLSRNNHGAGFFDGDEERKDELQDAAESYGEFYLLVGDDGEIYGGPLDSPGAGETQEGGGQNYATWKREVIGHVKGKSRSQAERAFDQREEEMRARFRNGDSAYDTAYAINSGLETSSHAQRGAAEAPGNKDSGPPYKIEALNSLTGTRNNRGKYPSLEEATAAAQRQASRSRSFATFNVLDRRENIVASFQGSADTPGGAGMRDHAVHDYIAVDRNDRRVAGPFKHRHEADQHVPPGGHVKFSTAHRRGPPSPAPSAYPMFRQKVATKKKTVRRHRK